MIFWWVVPFAVAVLAIPLVIEGNRKRMDDFAREAAPGKLARLAQGVTHYQWHGSARGPVVVCIHGLTTPSFVWKSLVPGLALMGFRVLTYDLYGRGWSDRPRGLQTRNFFETQLNDLLDHEQVSGRITLIGYSMGGAIAAVWAANNPERVGRLILLAPAGMGVVAKGAVRFIAQTPLIGDWLMLARYPEILRRGIEAENVPEVGVLQERELDYKGFVPAVLSSLRGILGEQLKDDHRIVHNQGIPVLAIWGQNDTVIPLTAMGRLAEWSRNARQEVIAGAGHGLTYTHAQDILPIIESFIASHPARD